MNRQKFDYARDQVRRQRRLAADIKSLEGATGNGRATYVILIAVAMILGIIATANILGENSDAEADTEPSPVPALLDNSGK